MDYQHIYETALDDAENALLRGHDALEELHARCVEAARNDHEPRRAEQRVWHILTRLQGCIDSVRGMPDFRTATMNRFTEQHT